MIPGTTAAMEDLLLAQTKEVGHLLYKEMMEQEEVKKKMERIGITPNTTLSEISEKYNLLPVLLDEFESRFNLATNKLGCINQRINSLQQKYETVLPGNDYISVLLNIDTGSRKWHWPPDYIAYHCKMEGFNPKLNQLTLALISELGLAEKWIVKQLESVLEQLAKGYATVLFYEELLRRKSELLGEQFYYSSYSPDSGLPLNKITWEGSPKQFVMLIKLLSDNEFLSLPHDQRDKIDFLLQHFNILSQRGLVSAETLRDYFGNPKIKFSKADAELPLAENPRKTSTRKMRKL